MSECIDNDLLGNCPTSKQSCSGCSESFPKVGLHTLPPGSLAFGFYVNQQGQLLGGGKDGIQCFFCLFQSSTFFILTEKVRQTNPVAKAGCAGDKYWNQECNFYPQWYFFLLCLNGMGHSCILRMDVHWKFPCR